MAVSLTSSHAKISGMLRAKGVRIDRIAFYNEDAFRVVERHDPIFLQYYAAWVRSRPRDTAYEERVRKILPAVAEAVASEVARDGKVGVCIDVSMMLLKMLEAQDIWCYAAAGALTIASKLRIPIRFCKYDVRPTAGHYWIVAPPFEIVDITLPYQLWHGAEREILPSLVLLETAKRFEPAMEDYLTADYLRMAYAHYGRLPPDFHLRAIHELTMTNGLYPSWEVQHRTTTLRYSAGVATVSEALSLHAITSHTWNGRLAGEMYDQVVVPAVERLRREDQPS